MAFESIFYWWRHKSQRKSNVLYYSTRSRNSCVSNEFLMKFESIWRTANNKRRTYTNKQLETLSSSSRKPIEIFQLEMLSTVSYFSTPRNFCLHFVFGHRVFNNFSMSRKFKFQSINRSTEPNRTENRHDLKPLTHTQTQTLNSICVRHGIQFSVFNFEFPCVEHFYFFFNSRYTFRSFIYTGNTACAPCSSAARLSERASEWLSVAGSWSRIYHPNRIVSKVRRKKECEKTYMNPATIRNKIKTNCMKNDRKESIWSEMTRNSWNQEFNILGKPQKSFKKIPLLWPVWTFMTVQFYQLCLPQPTSTINRLEKSSNLAKINNNSFMLPMRQF